MNRLDILLMCDPGHGWGRVERKVLHELGVADKVSACSYQSRNERVVYLEEDCDLPLLTNAAREAGWEIHYEITLDDEPSFIRSMPSYVAEETS